MRRKAALILLLTTLLSLFTPLLPQKAFAGNLGSMVKIDRLAVSKTTGGTICATPETSGVETEVQIVFPTGFTVNSTASNWTVTTTNLPTGSVALPGIGTATGVSGQTVTFPSSDLSVGTQYCFNFAAAGTLTTPSSTGTYTGILRTVNASAQVVDYRAFAISIVSSDSISVTARVGAVPSDYQAVLAKLTQGTTFRQSTEIAYTITYGNILPFASDVTLEAEWSLGTVRGDSTPTISIINYKSGTATTTYDGIVPVIDTVNRKIQWHISNFPPEISGKTVSFTLKTADDSPTTTFTPVSFTISSRIISTETQSVDSSITSYYEYPQPNATHTPTPPGTPSPTPGTTSPNPVINDIGIRTISANQAAVYIETALATKIKIAYGTSQTSLSQSVISNEYSKEHLITLTNLKPATRYYFKVTVTNRNGNSITSDLYVFDTANAVSPPRIEPSSLVVTSNDVVLTDPLSASAGLPFVVIPAQTEYSFKFGIKDYQNVKLVKAIARDLNVLGISSFKAYASSEYLAITEIAPGQYIGKLLANSKPGKYKVIVQIQDFNGNIAEEELTNMVVVSPLRIINASTKAPIENAKVILYFYNSRLKTFDVLSSNITPVKNPNYSESNGEISTVLPDGKYRAEVSALAFETATIEFEIGPNSPNYPEVSLKPLPFSFATYITYSATTAYDVLDLLRTYLHTLRSSIRFFDLITFSVIILFTVLSLFTTSQRMAVPIVHLPKFAVYQLINFIRRRKNEFAVHGKIIRKITGEVVPNAFIYFANSKNETLSHTKSNSSGEFLSMVHESDIKISIVKKGFKSYSKTLKIHELDDLLNFELEQKIRPRGFTFQSLLWYIEFIWSSLFEAILFSTLIVELLFTMEFGWLKVLPFIAVSILNILLWAMNIKNSRSAEV